MATEEMINGKRCRRYNIAKFIDEHHTTELI